MFNVKIPRGAKIISAIFTFKPEIHGVSVKDKLQEIVNRTSWRGAGVLRIKLKESSALKEKNNDL